MDEKQLSEIEDRAKACDEFHDLRCPSLGQLRMADVIALIAEVRRLTQPRLAGVGGQIKKGERGG